MTADMKLLLDAAPETYEVDLRFGREIAAQRAHAALLHKKQIRPSIFLNTGLVRQKGKIHEIANRTDLSPLTDPSNSAISYLWTSERNSLLRLQDRGRQPASGSYDDFALRLDLVMSAPDIGERTALTLIIRIPELDHVSRGSRRCRPLRQPAETSSAHVLEHAVCRRKHSLSL